MTGAATSEHAARRRRIESDLRQEPYLNHHETPPVAIDAALARHRVPGCAVAVVADGHLAWSQGYGVAAQGEALAVASDTIFQACSISKPVAALAALRLVQEGRLDLDRDINAYLRSWRVPANGDWQPRVTLRHLLTHSAGLTACWYPGYRRGTPLPTTVQTLRGEPPANTPPVRVTALPGTQYRYSGSHYSALQQLLVDLTGQPFASLVRDLVFAPLGMDDSSYETDFPARHGGATAVGHDAGGERIVGDWRVLPESAGAGLWTTPADLCRLAAAVSQAWRGESTVLLDQATAQQMLAPHLGGRGLGWAVEMYGPTVCFRHGGSNIGYRCHLVAWPEAGVGAAVMTNADDGSYLVQELLDAIAREYAWPDPRLSLRRAPAPADAAASLPNYVGTYGDSASQTVTVAMASDGLRLIAPDQPPLSLHASGDHRFQADNLAVTVTFEIGTSIKDRSGEVIGITLHQGGQELTLARVV